MKSWEFDGHQFKSIKDLAAYAGRDYKNLRIQLAAGIPVHRAVAGRHGVKQSDVISWKGSEYQGLGELCRAKGLNYRAIYKKKKELNTDVIGVLKNMKEKSRGGIALAYTQPSTVIDAYFSFGHVCVRHNSKNIITAEADGEYFVINPRSEADYMQQLVTFVATHYKVGLLLIEEEFYYMDFYRMSYDSHTGITRAEIRRMDFHERPGRSTEIARRKKGA